MKILIIGSEGFIGSNLLVYLKSKNHDVVCTDIHDFNRPNYFQLNKEKPNFMELFRDNNFEVCYNCSGAANVNLSVQNPLTDYELNTYNVYRILDSIRTFNKSCIFINLSSAAVYGNPKVLPIKEDVETKPISPYGFHKLAAERLGNQFSTLYQMVVINVRIFSVYGPGLKKQIFWDVYQKYKESNKIDLFGTGLETRDFIYIKDLCNVLELLSKSSSSKIINIASGKSITIKMAVEKFLSNFPLTTKLEFNEELRRGDPLFWEADISKMLELGKIDFIPMEEGLKKTADWIKSY